MPALAQDIATGTTAALVALLFACALYRALCAHRDQRWLILRLAASTTVFMEPFACFMVKAHHPVVGVYVLVRGLGVTVPAQLLFFYILYFAPTAAFLIHRARQRVSVTRYRLDFALIYALLFGGEALAIYLGVWFFFGSNPFMVMGLPLWIALTNIAAYAPVSLPTAVELYARAGLDHTVPAAVVSALIGLLVILATRHLLAEIESGAVSATKGMETFERS